jgi:ribosomal protein S7
MPRRREVPERVIIPDAKYKNKLVSKFIASIMRDGKKSTAESLLYGAFDIISDKTKEDPLKIFEKALENVKPVIEVKSRRVGGSTYQVPTEDASFPQNGPWDSMGHRVCAGSWRERVRREAGRGVDGRCQWTRRFR